MLQFLLQRSLSRASVASEGDPWHGVGPLALRTMEDGPTRAPSAWLHRWPDRVVADFWQSQSHGLLKSPSSEGVMQALVKAQNAGRKRPVVWGEWPRMVPSVMMGVVLPPAFSGADLPDEVSVVGVEFPPGDDEALFRQVLEGLRAQGRQAWWVIPAKAGSWKRLEKDHYILAHRMGVSLWLEAPPQSGWADYQQELATVARKMCRDATWEQWIWPVCDLLQKGFEEALSPLAPRGLAPWRWEGRVRRPDWRAAQRVVWESAEESLGGSGVMDELLVASALARQGLLKEGGDR